MKVFYFDIAAFMILGLSNGSDVAMYGLEE